MPSTELPTVISEIIKRITEYIPEFMNNPEGQVY